MSSRPDRSTVEGVLPAPSDTSDGPAADRTDTTDTAGTADTTDTADTTAGSFRAHGLWALIGRLANLVVVAGSSFLFARLMPNEGDFGTFTFYQTLITALGLAAGLGGGETALRFVSATETTNVDSAPGLRRVAKAIFSLCLLVAVVSSCGLYLVSDLTDLEVFESSNRVTGWIATAFAVSVAARGTHLFLAGTARAKLKLGIANLLDGANGGAISNGLLLIGVVAASLVVTATWQAALVSLMIGNLLTTIIGFVLLRRCFRPVVRPTDPAGAGQESRPLLPTPFATGLPIAATSLVVFFIDQFDILYAGWTLDRLELDNYAAAKRVSLVLRVPFAMTDIAVAGVISRLYASHRHGELQKLLSGTATISLVISILASIPLIVFPKYLLTLGFGEGFELAAEPMIILLVGQIIMLVGGSSQQLLTLTRYESTALGINLVAAVTCVGLVLLVGGGTPVRIATCFAAATVVRGLLMWWRAYRVTGINAAPSPTGVLWAISLIRSNRLRTEQDTTNT